MGSYIIMIMVCVLFTCVCMCVYFKCVYVCTWVCMRACMCTYGRAEHSLGNNELRSHLCGVSWLQWSQIDDKSLVLSQSG